MVGKENIKVTDKPMKKIFIRLSIEKSLFIVNPTLSWTKLFIKGVIKKLNPYAKKEIKNNNIINSK